MARLQLVKRSLGALLILVCLGGCGEKMGPASVSVSPAVSAASATADAASRQALSDGRVSFAEYEQGFLAFQACMSATGAPLSEVRLDRVTKLYDYVTPRADDPENCYAQTFQALDMVWQMDPERPGNSTIRTEQAMRMCLSEAGAEVTDVLAGDLLDLMTSYHIDLKECVDGYTDQSSP